MTAETKTTLKGYFNTGDQPTEAQFTNLIDTIGGGATLVVAANDASDASKGRADYICDGTADDVEILAAIAALTTTGNVNLGNVGGGSIMLSEGNFSLTQPIDLDGLQVHMFGAGMHSTRLNFEFASQNDCIHLNKDADNSSRCYLHEFTLTGNANARYGIHLQSDAALNRLRDIQITLVDTAIRSESSTCCNTFQNIFCRDCDNGLDMRGTNNQYDTIKIIGANPGPASGTGLYTEEVGAIYKGLDIERYTTAMDVTGVAENISFLLPYLEANVTSVVVDGTDPDRPFLITFDGGRIVGSTHATNAGIYLGRCQNVNLNNVQIRTSTSDKSLETTSDALAILIIGGSYRDTTPFTIGDRDEISIKRAYTSAGPYITENHGITNIANGTTSTVVAHGLSLTPEDGEIMVTLAEDPTNTPGAIWVSAIGDTNFTVNCENDPGATNLNFGWRAHILKYDPLSERR
jgi:hypothetical protein